MAWLTRERLARLPLPMLALSAAWGVWQFQALFVPWPVALLSAMAFEAVYLSLAFADVPDRRRARAISVAAVVVSVAYNVLSGLFHLRPALLDSRPLWADVSLAVLHGAPLAVVAYAVADLLVHRDTAAVTVAAPEATAPVQVAQVVTVTLPEPATPLSRADRLRQLALTHGVSVRTIERRIVKGELTL